jgi:hypothetical protein
LNTLENVLCYTGEQLFELANYQFTNMALLIDYACVHSNERRSYITYNEHLIEQIQYNTVNLTTDIEKSEIIRLHFNHPTKEIIFATRNVNFISKRKYLGYGETTNDIIDNSAKAYVERLITLTEPSYSYIMFDESTSEITIIKQNIMNRLQISFINKNSTEINKLKGLKIYIPKLSRTYENENFDLSSYINNAIIKITHEDGNNIMINACSIEHTLTINNVSKPYDEFKFIRDNENLNYEHQLVTIMQPTNYGVNLDGSINPIDKCSIQINGIIKVDEQDDIYFNTYQPFNYHTRIPSDGINVYSFALYPEQLQPSGSINFSNLEHVNLITKFKQNMVELEMHVFGISYNILKTTMGKGELI